MVALETLELLETLEPRRLLSFTPIGPAISIPGTASASDFDLAVAPGNGSFIVVAHLSSGEDDSILAVRYSAAGEQIGMPLTLDNFSGHGNQVSASMDADGDAVVAYAAEDNTIGIVRISKSGIVSAPTFITPQAGAEEIGPAAVSMDSGGGYFVAWSEYANEDSIQARSFDSTGAPRAAQFDAVTIDAVSLLNGDVGIASRPDGSGAVLTYSITNGIGLDNAQYRLISQSAAIGDVRGISRAYGDSNFITAVAVHPDGSFIIGYEEIDIPAAGADVILGRAGFVRRFSANGEAIGGEIELGESLPGSDPLARFTKGAALDLMPDGGFIAAFVQKTSDSETLYLRRYDADGVSDVSGPEPVGPNVPTDQETSPQVYAPSIGVAGDGTIVLANRATATFDTGPVQVQRFSSDLASVTELQNGVLFVRGTAGNDTLTIAPDGSDIVVTGGATPLRFAAANVNVILADGFGGDDTITNDTAIKATLRGGAGSDTIFGGTGEDRLHGGIGNDSLWGGNGPDKIFGEDGVDSLYGNGGNDRIEGGAQHDHIRGNAGHDMLFGNGGNDELFGGADADRLYGQAGTDVLWGEGGNDRLYGDDGFADILHGGAGNDVFITLDGAIDQLFGDGGRDSLASGDANDVLTSIEVT